MLMELRTSGAKDARVRQAFYQKVIQSLDMGESNYLLLLASDNYDVPPVSYTHLDVYKRQAAMRQLGLKRSTFYRLVKQQEEKHETEE